MSPEYVRPYVKSHKNDDWHAEAIAEAATRPTMRFVELKSSEQLDMQSLHRVPDRLVGGRTALLNQLRAVLMERGITVAQGRRKLEQHLAAMLEGEEVRLSRRVRALLEDMRVEWRELDRRIEAFDDEFAALAKTDAAARRLVSIPGIGVLNATALVAAIGNGATFARGRDLAAGRRRRSAPARPRPSCHHPAPGCCRPASASVQRRDSRSAPATAAEHRSPSVPRYDG
jgi:transposase